MLYMSILNIYIIYIKPFDSSLLQQFSLFYGASLALVGDPSSDGITIKIPYGLDVLLHRPASHSIFSYWVG